ncbi:hypothetical protein [Ekhidna sp.]
MSNLISSQLKGESTSPNEKSFRSKMDARTFTKSSNNKNKNPWS